MGSDLSTRDVKPRYSYHKDHWHKIENYKTLKQFLEGLIEQGHLSEYVRLTEKKADQGKEVDEGMAVVQVNRLITGVIEAIHGITDSSAATRNYLRARLIKARFWSEAHPITEVMFVQRDKESNLLYELTFTE